MASTPDLLSLNRVDLTRIACDAIAAQGRKPSIGLVREWTLTNCGGKKGSDGDVQKDIGAWFDDLLKLKRDRHIDGLPDAVATLARDMWQLSVMTANASLQAERQQMADAIASFEVQLAQANVTKMQLEHDLALRDTQLSELEAELKHLQEKTVTVEHALATQGGLLAAKDERITGIECELKRQSVDHAARIEELAGLRRHSLGQIEQARADALEWKAQHRRTLQENKELLATQQSRTTSFVQELAKSAEQLREREIAAAISARQIAALEKDLHAAHAALAALKSARKINDTKTLRPRLMRKR